MGRVAPSGAKDFPDPRQAVARVLREDSFGARGKEKDADAVLKFPGFQNEGSAPGVGLQGKAVGKEIGQ